MVVEPMRMKGIAVITDFMMFERIWKQGIFEVAHFRFVLYYDARCCWSTYTSLHCCDSSGACSDGWIPTTLCYADESCMSEL